MLDTLNDVMLNGESDTVRLKAVDRMMHISGFTVDEGKRSEVTNNVLALIEGGGGSRVDDLVSAWKREATNEALVVKENAVPVFDVEQKERKRRATGETGYFPGVEVVLEHEGDVRDGEGSL